MKIISSQSTITERQVALLSIQAAIRNLTRIKDHGLSTPAIRAALKDIKKIEKQQFEAIAKLKSPKT